MGNIFERGHIFLLCFCNGNCCSKQEITVTVRSPAARVERRAAKASVNGASRTTPEWRFAVFSEVRLYCKPILTITGAKQTLKESPAEASMKRADLLEPPSVCGVRLPSHILCILRTFSRWQKLGAPECHHASALSVSCRNYLDERTARSMSIRETSALPLLPPRLCPLPLCQPPSSTSSTTTNTLLPTTPVTPDAPTLTPVTHDAPFVPVDPPHAAAPTLHQPCHRGLTLPRLR